MTALDVARTQKEVTENRDMGVEQKKRTFNAVSSWLKKRYGAKVRKVALTTPFGCPNRDGVIDLEGCLFCDEKRAGFATGPLARQSVKEQLLSQIETMEKRAKTPQLYMSYLQSGTNTYGPDHALNKVYEQAVDHPKVVAVAIGTRPDWIDNQKLHIIEAAFKGKDIWIELGVQTSNEISLKKLNRNHTFSDSAKAINLIKKRGFFVCAHLILGLPGEKRKQMYETIGAMNAFGVDGVKFHPLSITKGAPLEKIWRKGLFPVFERIDYVELVADLLERLSCKIVIQRLVGGGRPEVHLAPNWVLAPAEIVQHIERVMENRGSSQGDRFSET